MCVCAVCGCLGQAQTDTILLGVCVAAAFPSRSMYTTQIGTESECCFEMQSIIIIFILCMCGALVRAPSYGQLQLSTALFTRQIRAYICCVRSLVGALADLAYWRRSRNTWSKSWNDFYAFLNEYRIHTRPSMQLLSIVQRPIDSFINVLKIFIY